MKIEDFSLCLLPFLWAVAAQSTDDVRKLHFKFLCTTTDMNSGTHNLVHTRAVGSYDTLHYVISSWGPPGILVARTSNASLLDVECDNFFSGNASTAKHSLKFSEKPDYVYGLLLTKLYEYNDVDDVANLDEVSSNASLWKVHDLGELDLSWRDSQLISDVERNTVVLKLGNGTEGLPKFQGNGSLTFDISLFNGSGVNGVLPHLQHTANSSQLDFIIDHMIPAFSNSRFALEMVFFTTDGANQTMSVASQRSIDDEHTPGVFEYIDVTSRALNQTSGAFLQWKPVSYKTSDLTAIEGATRASCYPLKTLNASRIQLQQTSNLANAYFGDRLDNQLSEARAINVSFGLSKDKFYASTNFSAWSVTLGNGAPPTEEISLVVILVISIGLGIPVVILIVGGIGLCVKKRRQRGGATVLLVDDTTSGGYQRIN